MSFIVKDNQELCRLEQFTLSALKAEIQERMHMKAGWQILQQQVKIHGCEKTHNEVDDDIDVDNIPTDAVE